MDAATRLDRPALSAHQASPLVPGQIVNAKEFRQLLVSHRRMVRADQRSERLKGLHDLDTGELFLIDERRLLEASR